MSSKLELRTLGALSLRGADGRELDALLAQTKRVALLTYLAVAAPRGFHRRDKLVAVFWPELDQEHARSALRTALRVLREGLGGGVLNGRGQEEVGLDPARWWCDAVKFEGLLDAGRLEEALELYRGDFLDGFHLGGCPEFERWQESERACLKERAAEAAWHLAERAEAAGDSPAAARWARRTPELCADDEGMVRRLIALLDQLGDGAGALHLYDVFARRLKEDYDGEPAPETRAAILAVRERAAAAESDRPVARVGPEQPAPASPPSRHLKPTVRRNGKTLVFSALGAAALAILLTTTGLPVIGKSGKGVARLEHRVVVAPFENRTGDSSLAPIGHMAADWITEGLAQTGIAEIITLPTVLKAFQPHNSDGEPLQGTDGVRALAAAVGASWVIWGSYYRDRDELTIHAQAADAERGTVLGVVGPVKTSLAAVGDAVETLRQRVMGLLATHFDERLAPWAADIGQPPLYQAYLEYVQGIEATTFKEKDHHFIRATDIDPSFTRAWLEALSSLTDFQPVRDWEAWTDSGYAILGRSRDAMSPADRHHLDAMINGVLQQDWLAFYHAMRKAASYAPDKRPTLAVAAFNLGRYREMVDVWLSQETPAILRPPDPGATKQVTAALHFLGEHEHELALARQGKRAHPGHITFYEMENNALVALGRIAEVEATVEEALSGPTIGSYTPAHFLLALGNELLWHGHDAAARRFLERAEALQRGVVERGRSDPMSGAPLPAPAPRQRAVERERGDRRALATVLLFLGRWDEALRMSRELYAEGGRPEDLASVGVAAARSGRRDEALRVMQELERLQWALGQSWGYQPRSWYQAYVAGALEDCELMGTLLRKAFTEGALHQYLHRRLGFYYCRRHSAFVELAKPRG